MFSASCGYLLREKAWAGGVEQWKKEDKSVSWLHQVKSQQVPPQFLRKSLPGLAKGYTPELQRGFSVAGF